MAKRPKVKHRVFNDRMHNRDYRVRVFCNAKTGRLLAIRAGCRHWQSFEQALAHYSGGWPYKARRWKSINWCHDVTHLDSTDGSTLTDFHNRHDALLALSRVAARVQRWQRKLKGLRA